MARLSDKEKNLRKGILGRTATPTTPVVVQDNNVIRTKKETTGRKPRKKAQPKKEPDNFL